MLVPFNLACPVIITVYLDVGRMKEFWIDEGYKRYLISISEAPSP